MDTISNIVGYESTLRFFLQKYSHTMRVKFLQEDYSKGLQWV